MIFGLLGCIELGFNVDGQTITEIERVRYIRILFNHNNGNMILSIKHYVHAHTSDGLKVI